jgi:hypothetical protein
MPAFLRSRGNVGPCPRHDPRHLAYLDGNSRLNGERYILSVCSRPAPSVVVWVMVVVYPSVLDVVLYTGPSNLIQNAQVSCGYVKKHNF